MNLHKQLNNSINKVGLFCNARDENHIKEWAAHHLLIGFDNIIIFDHKSINPLKNVFSTFDKRVHIVETRLPDGNIKMPLMNYAIKLAKKLRLDWFIYLDADEFIILHDNFKGVKHFLNTYSSRGDSIGVNWLMFGTNYLINDPSGTIIESYTRSAPKLDKHVKSFVKTSEAVYSSNPHFYHIRNPMRAIGLDFKTLHKPQCFSYFNYPFNVSPAYIAHYVFQSEENYLNRKIKIIADDGTKRSNMGKKIHKLYNNIVNLQPQKYLKQIKDFLSFYS